MKRLHEAITEIDVHSPPKIYVEKILQAICDNLGYRFGTAIEIDEEGKGWMFASYNLPGDYPEKVNKVKAPVLSSPSGEAIETGKVVVVYNPLAEPRLVPWHEVIRPYNFKIIVWVPLLSKGHAFGTYVLYDTQVRDITEEEIQMLEQIGVMVSIAISSNQYLDQLNQKTKELEEEIIERKRVEEKRRLFSQAADSSIDGVAMGNLEGRITYANETFVRMFGYSREELIGREIAFIYAEAQIPKLEEAIKATMEGCWTGELVGKRKSGELFPMLVSASRVFGDEGKVIAIMANHRDITERKRAEKALWESEERLDLAVKGTGAGLWDWMVQTGETVFNERWAEIVGYTLEELSPVSIETWIKLTHPDDLKRSNELLERHSAGETEYYECEARMKHKSGEWIWVIDRGKVFEWDKDGKPVRMIGTHLDITERKRAEAALRETRERLAVTLKSIGDGVIATGTKGRVTLMNDVAQELTGWKIDEAIGLPSHEIFRIINEKTRNPVEDPIARVLREGNIVGLGNHSVLIARDGTERAIADSGAPIKASDGTTIGVVLVFRDVTEMRRVEEEREAALNNLAETNMKLEERAKELEGARLATLNIAEDLDEARIEAEKAKEDLEETNIKLEKSNRELQDFTYIASHDLREPMRKISAFGQLLQESLKGKLDEDEEENFAFMIDGATRMQQMIDALLAYSRVTTQAKPAKRVDLNKGIEDIKSVELAVLLEETGGTIHVPEPLPAVQADPSQVHQLLQNLIGNGLKFHREGIAPEITVRSRRVNDNIVQVGVEDNGIGIEEANYEKIFGMFQRLHSREDYGGTGIGLAVCKKIVERHGGSIGVNSAPGKGSTFWFTMPRSEKGDERGERGERG